MSKEFKIKRYRHIYRRGPSPSHIIGTVVAVLVLAFVGWNAYGPVRDYFSGALAANSPSGASSAASVPQQASSAPAPQAEQPAAPALPTDLQGIYLPTSVLADAAALDAMLETLSRTGLNAVLFDLKDAQGNVLYQSGLDLVKQAGSQTADAYDLAGLCKKLQAKNLIPIGRLNAFKDPFAASRLESAGVRYSNTDMLWLDNDPTAGGKPWLNPYSTMSQTYLTDIATEAVALGVKRVLLDQYGFPSGFGLEFANYGANAATTTRSDVLSTFIDKLDSEVASLGGQVSLYLSGTAALGASNTYYGTSPLTLANGSVTIGVMPAQFGDSYALDAFSLTAPVNDPKGTVNALLEALAPDLAGMEVSAMLQAYQADYTIQNNHMYTTDDINAQIAACAANGIKSYILYSPDGNYPQ